MPQELLEKIERYAFARDRRTDKEVRTFTLTDDEGMELLAYIWSVDPDAERRG